MSSEVPLQVSRDRNLHIIFAVTLMNVLGVSSIAPALPTVARALDVTPQRIGLLITTFTVPGVLLTPLLGVLADRYGRKRILVPSLFLFGLAGVACAGARDFDQLLVLRFLQGIGAAAMGSLNITLVGDLYQGRARATAMGCNASVLSLGTAGYPALGGGLAQLGWRYPFLLPLLGVLVGLWVLFGLRNPEPHLKQPFREYLGGIWQSVFRREVIGLFAVSALTFILLFGSILTYFPLLLDSSFGASPAVIGLVVSSSSVATAVMSSRLGWLTRRFREIAIIRFSFVLYAAALALIPLMPSLLWFIVPAMLFGAAMGLNLPSLLTLLTGLVPMERRAAFMSLHGMVLRLGQTLGPLVMGAAYTLGGFEVVFYGGAGLALLTLLLVGVMASAEGLARDPAVDP